MKQHILGISRAPQFSPNSEGRDAAIFAALTSRLERKGYAVDIISEDLVTEVDLADYDLVFSMARGRNVLSILSQPSSQDCLSSTLPPAFYNSRVAA